MTNSTLMKDMDVRKLDSCKKELQSLLQRQVDLLEELESVSWIKNVKEGSLNPENRQKFIKLLKGEIKKLDSFDVVIAVVGTMKAGKSTTINAIIGKEIMPNRNRPMTAIPTRISHVKNQENPVLTIRNKKLISFIRRLKSILKKYNKDRINQLELKGVADFIQNQTLKSEYIGQSDICNTLQLINDLPRFTSELWDGMSAQEQEKYKQPLTFPFDAFEETEHLPLISVTFKHLEGLENSQGRLTLLDTPGPNEAKQPEIKKVMSKQLERCSATIVVIDYTQISSEAEEDVKTQIQQVERIDADRIFLFANKLDQKTGSSEDIEQTKLTIWNSLLSPIVDNLHNENYKQGAKPLSKEEGLKRIFAGSAQRTYLAQRMQDYVAIKNERPNIGEGSWVNDFINIAYGGDAEEYEECSLKSIHRKITLQHEKFGTMQPFFKEVIQKSQLNAPMIAMSYALKDIAIPVERIHNFLGAQGYVNKVLAENKDKLTEIEALTNKLQSYTKELKQDEKNAEKNLSELIERLKKESTKDFEMVNRTIVKEVNDIFRDANEQEKKKIQEKIDDAEEKTNYMKYDPDYKKKKDELNKLLAKKKSDNPDIRDFEQKDEAIEFLKKINGLFIKIIHSFGVEKVKASVKDNTTKLQENVAEIESSTNKIFESIKGAIDQTTDLDVKFNKPKLPELDLNENIQLNSKDFISEDKGTRYYEKSGWFNKVKRWFNKDKSGSGYGKEQYDIYIFNLITTRDKLKVEYKKNVQPKLYNYLEACLKQMSQESVLKYINEISQQAEYLHQDIKTAIDMHSKKADEVQDTYIKTAERLASINKEIEEDMIEFKEYLKLKV